MSCPKCKTGIITHRSWVIGKYSEGGKQWCAHKYCQSCRVVVGEGIGKSQNDAIIMAQAEYQEKFTITEKE